jgi:ParB family chromosome partitioning protein
LGKGLEALIPVHGNIEESPSAYSQPAELSIEHIRANPFQPRQEFDPLELEELAASIREKGIVQPVIVRPRPDGQYELVAGERRLRAAKLAGLAQIPVTVREVNDSECLEIALIENIQRSNLNSLEEAMAYQQLMSQFNLTQEEMAKKVGKERSSVANTLRLLKLPNSIREMIKKKRLSEGHARALLGISDEQMMERLAEKIVRDNLSVRETERIASGIKPEKAISSPKTKKSELKDPHTRQLEEELRRKLGTQVKVLPRSAKKGKIEIEYYSLEDLDRILSLLG